MQTNMIQRFLLENLNVRGVIVQADNAWQDLLNRREYPENVQDYLGEAVAATLLMTANLKTDSRLLLQLQGEGEVSLLVVQADNRPHFRAMAKLSEQISHNTLPMTSGVLMLRIEQNNGEAYQGFTNIDENGMAKSIENYFEQSEQLPTLIALRADGEQIAGVLLQALPSDHQSLNPDDWQRLGYLLQTLNLAEFKHKDLAQILKSVFAEDDLRLFESKPVAFECVCSEERTLAMLSGLDNESLQEIADNGENVSVMCDFCGSVYVHSPQTIGALLQNKLHPN